MSNYRYSQQRRVRRKNGQKVLDRSVGIWQLTGHRLTVMLLLVDIAMGHELIRLLAERALETIWMGFQIEGQLVQCGEAIKEEVQPGESLRASVRDTSMENL